MIDAEQVDLLDFLKDRDIDVATRGKNVGKGYVAIHCPFPACTDRSKHLVINRKTKIFRCWKCDKKGDLEKLIMEIDQCSKKDAAQTALHYQSFFNDDDTDESQIVRKKSNLIKILPIDATDTFPHLHLNYLRSRNFDPDKIIPKYGLKAVYNTGDYRGRIIVPVYLDHKIVSFVARDVTNMQEPKYLNCPDVDSVVPVPHTLYNIDTVRPRGKAILFEGVTDVWRVGDSTIASFRAGLTPQQIKMLIDRRIKKLFMMYDPDAKEKARRYANELTPFMSVELISLDDGDPAQLNNDDVRALRKDLLEE